MTSYTVLDVMKEITKIPSVGSSSGLEGVHLNPPTPQRNDKGTIGVSAVKVAAAIGVATLTTIASIAIANKQYKIAKRYWQLARERFDYFQNTYRPIEEQELLEISVDKLKKVDYQVYVSPINNKIYAKAQQRIQMLLGQSCQKMGIGMIRDITTHNNLVTVNNNNYILRRRENLAQADNDLLYNRQMAIANRGRNLMVNSVTWSDMALKSYRNQADGLQNAAEGASKFLGLAFGLDRYNGSSNSILSNNPIQMNTIANPINTVDSTYMGNYNNFDTPENYSNEDYGRDYTS